MQLYDLSYLISPELEEKKAKELSQKITDSLKEQNGVLDNAKELTKIALAYPILGKKSAFLACLDLSLSPEKIQGFKEKLRSENNILRFLIFVKKSKKPKFIKELSKISEKKPTKKKVELKDIEKKLEEILKF